MDDLVTSLKRIGLHYVAAHLDDIIDLATRQRMSPRQLAEHLAEIESKDRLRRSLERRTANSQLGRFKPMASFDWSWPRAIDRDAVEAALRLDFVAEPRNVVLVAAQGLGKTMIAQNIAHQAILAGHSVLFTTAARMLVDLGSVHGTAHLFNARLRKYTRVGLLVCDEIGYLSYDAKAADATGFVGARRHRDHRGPWARGKGARVGERGDDGVERVGEGPDVRDPVPRSVAPGAGVRARSMR